MDEGKKRNGGIDFWKFVFAMIIVMFHGKNLATTESWLFKGGNIGVEFFFIVSGFLMAGSSLKKTDEKVSIGKDTFSFIKKKVIGIMPNFYVAWVIAFLVEHIGNFSIKVILKDFMNSLWELLLLTESGLRGYTANAVAWYLSAMILAMLVLYPLMRKYKDSFFYMIAPICTIFIFGMLYQNTEYLQEPHAWMGWVYKSFLRALAEISLGCLCFKVSQKIKVFHYTVFARCMWSVLELSGYGFVIWYCLEHECSKTDWILAAALAMSITITFSGAGILTACFEHRVFNWLGIYSFSLYLGHGYWSHKMNILFPELGYWQRLPIYIALALGTGLFIMFISDVLKRSWHNWKPKVLGIIIEEK